MKEVSEMNIPNGVWPTMVTPFTERNEIDYAALGRLIDWYLERGVHGLFAVCQSSEMFYLSPEERVRLAAFVKKRAGDRVPVIASGHVSDRFEDQEEELKRMADTGIDALVLIVNRFAAEGEPDDVLWRNLERMLDRLPRDVPLGFYECPYPYKRLLTPELLRRCDETGRFAFLKDTCCDRDQIGLKLRAVAGGSFKIFNANSATLLDTLKLGANGFSGVMANFHPELYVWLHEHWQDDPDEAELLGSFLGMTSLIEHQLYPANAKYFLMRQGVLSNCRTRVRGNEPMTSTRMLEVEQLERLTFRMKERLGIG